ncbi:MAG: putative MATE family efflux protein [Myxococcota bacterium]|jgi:putative MATE family efflux protein
MTQPKLLSKTPMLAVVALGLPLVAATVFQFGFNLTEVWVFGSVGDQGASLAGAAASDIVTGIFALLANGIGNAAVAHISQAHGASDQASVRRYARQAIAAGVLLSLLAVVVGLLAAPVGALVMAEGETRALGTEFLRIMAIGSFGTIFLALAIAVLRSLGDSVRPLIVVAVMSIATLLLEAIFVLGLFGVEPHSIVAAAWITVGLRAVAGLALVWMIARRVSLRPKRGERFINLAALRELFRLGATSALQQSMRLIGFLVLLGIVSSRFATGEDGPNSAYTAINVWIKLDLPTLMMAFAWGGGVAPVVGMALGAGKPAYARRAAWSGVMAVIVTALVTMTTMLLFAESLAAIFLPDDPLAVRYTREIFMYAAPVYAFVTTGIVVANAYNGAGDMKTPLYWDAAIMLIVQTGLVFVLAVPTGLGIAGIGIALVVSGILQGVVPTLLLRGAKWHRVAHPADPPSTEA